MIWNGKGGWFRPGFSPPVPPKPAYWERRAVFRVKAWRKPNEDGNHTRPIYMAFPAKPWRKAMIERGRRSLRAP